MRFPAAVVPFLRQVLAGSPARWPAVSEETAARLLLACRWHGILPMLHVATQQAGTELPEEVAGGLHAGYLAAAAGSTIWLRERDAVARALDEAGVRVAMLKGAALAGWAYPDAATRPVGDLDILVGDAELDAAALAIAGLGYRRQLDEAAGYHHHWVFSKPLGAHAALTVELHRRLIASPPYDRLLDTDRLLARSAAAGALEPAPCAAAAALEPAPYDGVAGESSAASGLATWRVLSPPDLIVHLAAHLVLQHAGEERLVWVADIDRVARLARGDTSFWTATLATARSAWLVRSLSDSLRMSRHWFATPLPDAVLAALDESPTPQEAAAYVRLRRRPPVGHEGARLWSDTKGIRGVRAKVRYGIAYAFPPLAYMREKHGRGGTWALPLYYVRRIVRGAVDIVAATTVRGRQSSSEPPEARMVEP